MSEGRRARFYHSGPWKRTRKAYLDYRTALDGGLCEVCHDNLGDTVHHKTWLTDDNLDDPHIALDFENLRLECRDCHAKEKDPTKPPSRRYTFDENGNIIQADRPHK